jgi:predicted AlkP superfamily phosphohydrolase/phosphomutase
MGDFVRAAFRCRTALPIAALLTGCLASPAAAYIGPGAGFAAVSSLGVLFFTILLAAVALLAWPFRKLWRFVKFGRPPKSSIRRLIVVGLDGQDPKLTDRFLAEGKLPNFAKLAESGSYHRLKTTFPSVSPVAWSSFSTGTNPAKHNIFDFLDRDLRTYLPVLSSARVGKHEKFWKLGKWRIPRGRPELTLLRKSKPFWTILGEKGIWSTVLRVPITFPPDRFYGAELGAMSIPDLLGTQGTFLLLTTRDLEERFQEGGQRIVLAANGNDSFTTTLPGPTNVFREDNPPMEIPLTIRLDRGAQRARVRLNGVEHVLAPQELSDWITVKYSPAPGVSVTGICRMMVTEMGDQFSLYVTPIAIDPERPAMPISHPSYYATYLAKKIGPYCTLGLAEDTWALNERVTGDATFLTQTFDIDDERRAMFFAALDKLRRGALVCVFDGTDRIQHMFWRYLEEGHPAANGAANGTPVKDAIDQLYARNDELVGKVMAKLKRDDVLMVISDHGFTSFRRGVNLNAWLHANGYLALKPGRDGSAEWLRDVDWTKTRAYSLGLTGMFINRKGRESQGIVSAEESAAVKREIIERLSALLDKEKGEIGINEVFDTREIYEGPYLTHAPDLLIGYNHGYRVSWRCASGVVSGPVFEDNVKAWSGDHCVDPRIVPGVFFCNRKIDRENLSLVDVAPTALQLFGVDIPPHMDGSPFFLESEASS